MARLNAVTGETYVTLEYIRAIVLEDFSSLFNSEQLLWTPFKARSLERKIDPTPDATVGQLGRMVEGADDELIQFCAELLFIQQIFPSQIEREVKVSNVRSILESCTSPPTVPSWVTDENPGNFIVDTSFERYRLYHLDWLVKFVAEWHRAVSDRNALLRDPWRFRDLVVNLDPSPEVDAFRNAWLHMMFPDTFESITATSEKFRIREVFLDLIGGVYGDNIDVDLLRIRTELAREHHDGFDLLAIAAARPPRVSRDSDPALSVSAISSEQVASAQEDGLASSSTVAAAIEGNQSSSHHRRSVIALLRRDELLEVLETFEIKANRRINEKMVDAIAQSTHVELAEILALVSRDTLKSICELLQIDGKSREKAPLVQRILAAFGQAPAGSLMEPDRSDLVTTVARLLADDLVVTNPGKGWPLRGELRLTDPRHPVDLYLASMDDASGSERTFRNSVQRSIVDDPERHEILLGIWTEQGDERAVLVAFDVASKRNRSPRFAAAVPLQLLEQAADTGYATQEIARDEMLYAFRPDNLSRYFEILKDSPLKLDERPAKKKVDERRVRPIDKPDRTSEIYIRPQVGMYAAFARLNYKPWFALAEFLDNSIQSFLSNRPKLEAAGHHGPLVIDVNIDDNEISITDRACGIALEDFPRAFSPAAPPDDASGLSEFGLGMKAAACWFARKWNVRTSALGDPVERVVAFDIPKITRDGLENLPIETRSCRESDHFTVITMQDLRVHPRGKTLRKIRDHLSSIYRVLAKDGIVLIRLTIEGRTEELTYEPPDLLEAPFFRDPTGPSVVWRKEFHVDLGTRKVRGWAGIMKSGGYARAGFSVFRRRRLIEGSVGETYKPSNIFRSPNSFSSQRIVGELFVDGFDVTHTKDGIQWHGYEDEVLESIRQQLNDEPMRLLDQAEGYRAKRVAASLPKEFGSDALRSTVAALSTPAAVDALRTVATIDAPAPPAVEPTVHQQRVFKLQVIRDDRSWNIHLELVSDPAMAFYTTSTVSESGHDIVKVQVNLDHAFSIGHLNDSEASLSPVLRLVAALALAEKVARDSGVKSAGTIRANANQILTAIASEPAH